MKQEITLERCVDFLTRMIEKYGSDLETELSQNEGNKDTEK